LDIDDTVKLSNILSGARAVFHNVFVKDLRDNVIPGMGPWYMNMWKRGVRFHYVMSDLLAQQDVYSCNAEQWAI
jgi:phosphatidate phosphatase APP1